MKGHFCPSTGIVSADIGYIVAAAALLATSARAIGFLNSLKRAAPVTVGVIYGGVGNGISFRASAIAFDELTSAVGSFDILYLMPKLGGRAAEAASDAVRRLHAVSISNDPACLDAHACVLMVRSRNGTEIVLDMALADAAKARFSSIFTLMAKRR
jgi:hypothetical protein